MKKIFTLSVLCSLLFACNGTTEKTMTVQGNVKGLKKGILYLQHVPDSTLVVIDSMQMDGSGEFSFSTEIESPEIFYLYLNKKDNNDVNDRITFFGEPGVITINTNWNTFDSNAKIEGSDSNAKLEEYRKTMSRYNTKNLEILSATYDPEIQKDSVAMDSIIKLSDKNIVRGYLFALNFALNNRDSYIAPYIAVNEVPDANKKYLDSINAALTPEVANSKYGKQLQAYLKEIE